MLDGDSNITNTQGGSNIQGNASAGRDLVGRDQYNYYNAPSPKPENPISKEELAALYRQASSAHFAGDLSRAEELYMRLSEADPSYPGVSRSLRMIKNELEKPYVDMAGQIVRNKVHYYKYISELTFIPIWFILITGALLMLVLSLLYFWLH